MDEELAIRVDARIAVQVEVDHDHGDDQLVPMLEEPDRAELPLDGQSARIYYRCPACGQTVSVRAVANAMAGSEVALDGQFGR